MGGVLTAAFTLEARELWRMTEWARAALTEDDETVVLVRKDDGHLALIRELEPGTLHVRFPVEVGG